MKMVRAIIRPETVEKVADALVIIHPALTKIHAFGRGKTGGVKVGDVVYDELPKTMIMVVVKNEDKDKVVETICQVARTGKIGDGKLFVTDVEEVYTVRTGQKEV